MVDAETVKHVARISRINLTDAEVEKFSGQLSEVLDSFSLIKEVDTENIKPSFQPTEMKNAVRDDIPEDCLTQDEALSNAEQKEEKFFKGPRSV
jgi:aspartyl-tRNA(Asn)/glutamyl-tRNA(Gln) amidotransferase subunit C